LTITQDRDGCDASIAFKPSLGEDPLCDSKLTVQYAREVGTRLNPVGALCLICLIATCMRLAEAHPNDSPSVARTPARLVRGKYLTELAHCFHCHSERDAKGNQVANMKGAGRVLPPEESNIPLPYYLVCPNITPDRETGAGSWSDPQLRAIREGIGHDGRILHKTMPYWNFRYLTDEDLASIIVFLRSLPAVRHVLPKRNLTEQSMTDGVPKYSRPGCTCGCTPR
jgi:Cytochrome c